MAISKVCGIETEYGIFDPSHQLNPVAASSLLINAYVATATPASADRPTRWDFDDERPGSDARGFQIDDLLGAAVETHLVNAVLTNGARYYVDHAHPEYSSPECRTALDAVRYDRAGEEIIRASMVAAAKRGASLLCHKNNSDGKGNSYGCHENYLVHRHLPFQRLAALITPHFVTRQVMVGAGKVGCELPGVSTSEVPFQISQRADFFEEEIGLETTVKRPLVNSRDEPHCDASKYRRLHVIIGDANMSEVATLLKLGTTAIVLAMIEDDWLVDDLLLAHPVAAVRQISHDPTLRQTVGLRNGRRASAVEIQWQLFERASAYRSQRGLECVDEEVGAEVMRWWEHTLAGLESNPSSLATTVDWIAKQRMVTAFAERHALPVDDARLKAIDLQYHDMRPDKSLAGRAGLIRLVDPTDVEAAIHTPPGDTRAYFRGSCLAKWPEQVNAANWDSMVFDLGHDPLRRVPMAEPLRGTEALVGRLIADSVTPADLLAKLATGS